MLKFFIGGIVFLLLLGAGYGITTTQATRYIPWDCADWQAFAHDDRTTSILESLAENRGKTLYCGVDQSDTFTKTETWEAGRDRNERDDTVYFGERGSFRGFIAAQEGWLTEGESGVTGLSRHHIFEFPREPKKRRRWVTKRRPVPDTADRAMRGGWAPYGTAHATEATRQANADAQLNANVPFTEWQAMAERGRSQLLPQPELSPRHRCRIRGRHHSGIRGQHRQSAGHPGPSGAYLDGHLREKGAPLRVVALGGGRNLPAAP